MRQLCDLSLYLVTHKGTRTLEEFFHIIDQAIQGGVTIVQLRDKEMGTQDFICLARRLHARLQPLRIPLIINDRVEVAHAIQAEGIHLGQSDLKVQEARALLGHSALIGLSVETKAQAQAALEEDVDYLAASPVFATRTKSDCASPWGLQGLKELCKLCPYPVVAIGGIHEANVKEVFDQGAAGVAVVSAIFDAPCPRQAALNIKNRMRKDGFSTMG